MREGTCWPVGTWTREAAIQARGPEAQRLGGPERYCAKVQIGAELLCKSAKVNDTSFRVAGGGRRWRVAGNILTPQAKARR